MIKLRYIIAFLLHVKEKKSEAIESCLKKDDPQVARNEYSSIFIQIGKLLVPVVAFCLEFALKIS